MIKREELEKDLRYSLLRRKEICEKWPNSDLSNRGLLNIERIFENFPEYVRQHVAHIAREVVKAVCDNRSDSSILEFWSRGASGALSLGIKPNDPILGCLNSGRKYDYGCPQTEEVIQKIYESFGYTDKLITLPELRKMEVELKNIGLSNDPQRYSDLNVAIKVAKNHAGILEPYESETDHIFRTDEEIANWAKKIYTESIEHKKAK